MPSASESRLSQVPCSHSQPSHAHSPSCSPASSCCAEIAEVAEAVAQAMVMEEAEEEAPAAEEPVA